MSLSSAGSVSDTFGAAAASSYGTGGLAAEAGMTQTVMVQPVPPSLLDALAFHKADKDNGPQQAPEARLRAATHNTSGMWKPADTVRPGAVMKDANGFAQQHATPKAQAADKMHVAQVAEIKAAIKEMAAMGTGPLAEAPAGAAGGAGSGGAKNFITDALVTTGMTLAMGPAGGILATGMMAAKAGLQGGGFEGQGTLVTFNKGIDYSAPMPALRGSKQDARTRGADYGYSSSSQSPLQATTAAAPVSNALQQAMSKGPGFGKATMPGDVHARSTLAEAALDDMALKIAADSPAGKMIKGMSEDSKYARNALQTQRQGVDATPENVAAAANLGIDVSVPKAKIQTFTMA